MASRAERTPCYRTTCEDFRHNGAPRGSLSDPTTCSLSLLVSSFEENQQELTPQDIMAFLVLLARITLPDTLESQLFSTRSRPEARTLPLHCLWAKGAVPYGALLLIVARLAIGSLLGDLHMVPRLESSHLSSCGGRDELLRHRKWAQGRPHPRFFSRSRRCEAVGA